VLSLLLQGDGSASLLGEGAACEALSALSAILPVTPPDAAASASKASPAKAATGPQQPQTRALVMAGLTALAGCLFSHAALLDQADAALRAEASVALVLLFQLAWLSGGPPPAASSSGEATEVAERAASGSGASSSAGLSCKAYARQIWRGGQALKAVVLEVPPADRRELRSALLRPLLAHIDAIASSGKHVRHRRGPSLPALHALYHSAAAVMRRACYVSQHAAKLFMHDQACGRCAGPSGY
jgi:hypothetical protein